MVISTWKRCSDLAGHMMIGLGQVQDFCAVAGAIKDATALSDLMAEITKAMGFRHYALVHHVDLKPAVRSVHIVDYPQDWVERFQARRLYASDPIHRASHRTNVGFAWSAVQSIISLTAADRSETDELMCRMANASPGLTFISLGTIQRRRGNPFGSWFTSTPYAA